MVFDVRFFFCFFFAACVCVIVAARCMCACVVFELCCWFVVCGCAYVCALYCMCCTCCYDDGCLVYNDAYQWIWGCVSSYECGVIYPRACRVRVFVLPCHVCVCVCDVGVSWMMDLRCGYGYVYAFSSIRVYMCVGVYGVFGVFMCNTIGRVVCVVGGRVCVRVLGCVMMSCVVAFVW